MRIKQLIGALAFSGILAAGVAYAAATSENAVLPLAAEESPTLTATWTLGAKTFEGVQAVYSSADAFTASNLSFVGVAKKGTRAVTYDDGSKLTATTYNSIAADRARNENSYVEFSLSPAAPFIVKSIDFDWMTAKSGNGRIDVDLLIDGKSVSVATSQIPTRYNGNDTDKTANFHKTFNVNVPVANESVALRFYFYSTDKEREMGFANVVISGETYVPGTETAPAGWSVIPGTFNKIDKATDGTEAGWTKADKNIAYDNQDGQFGSITSGGWASINFFCDKAGAYEMVMPFRWDNGKGQTDDIHFVITDQATGKVEIDQHFIFTGGRDDKTIPLEGVISKGRKSFKVTFTGVGNTSYITNIMAPTFNWLSEDYDPNQVPAGYLEMPGALTLSSAYWTLNTIRIQNEGTETPNFGYTSNGAYASAKVFCTQEGVYSVKLPFYAFNSEGDVQLEVRDETTGAVESTGACHVAGNGDADVLLFGKITTGKKIFKLTFVDVTGRYCANMYAPEVALSELGEDAYKGGPSLLGGKHTPTEAKNHAVVTLSFDRPMQDAVATYNGEEVKADGGSNSLKFSLWNLDWDSEVTLTIAEGAAKDVLGNANTQDITYTVKVGAQPATVDPVKSVIYVTNVEELRAAVADVMATNNSAEAPRRVIILKDGDYDLGVSADNNAPLLHLNKAFNVSIIGESRDGVVVRGTVKGISYPVFSVRYSTNTYLENFTIKNEIGPDGGQAVALTGGVRDVMVNMLLLGYQDTYVSGERGYVLNCEIHGSVDFICGGGNHYFENCLFVTEREGSVVCAPNTSAAQKWGYVFQNCSIDGIAGYHLGRPWDNNPAAYYLNTTLLSLPAEEGWTKMGTLETRLYEYNSMDKDGNPLDLSGRKNPSTSTNKYTPVLTAEQAAEFTVENVLGGDDSWLATEEIATEINAPEGVAYEKEGNYIYWYPVDGAAGYMIYNNGQYVGYASGDCDHFDLATNSGYKKVQARAAEDYSYTIRAIAPNGTMSGHSFAMTPGNPTGIDAPEADNAPVEVLYYNLQGQPVEEGYRGAVIKVSVAADGTRTASKILAD